MFYLFTDSSAFLNKNWCVSKTHMIIRSLLLWKIEMCRQDIISRASDRSLHLADRRDLCYQPPHTECQLTTTLPSLQWISRPSEHGDNNIAYAGGDSFMTSTKKGSKDRDTVLIEA